MKNVKIKIFENLQKKKQQIVYEEIRIFYIK